MSRTSRTFRVFVSSTFDDFKEERDALQRFVFPRLAELCARHGGRFQAIDLRWGISEEAGLDQRTVAVCLDEISRCQRVTPRPNFIVLLGDRYGWRPLPARIEKNEFEVILANVPSAGGPDSDRALLLSGGKEPENRKGWYRLDENAVPAEYVLLPREVEVPEGATADAHRAVQEAEEKEWRGIEGRLRAILLTAIETLEWEANDPRRAKYVASATEQEIVRGALEPADAAEHVFGFSRTILTRDGKPLAKAVPADGAARSFLDEAEVGGAWVPDMEAHDRLTALKTKLSRLLGRNLLQYEATWTRSGITLDHIGAVPEELDDCLKLLDETDLPHALCSDVWRSLANMILRQLEKLEKEEAVEAEVAAHERFGADRRHIFVGRGEPLAAIARYLANDGQQPLAIIGEPGSGKSALMAKAVEEAQAAGSKAFTVARFIGATPSSSDGQTLLGNLCREITRKYGADESNVPTDYDDLAVEFGKRLQLATAQRPLIVFLDALDQLGPTDPARAVSWLPTVLPDHVRLVVSTLPGDTEGSLKAKRPGLEFLTLDRMTRREGDTALGQWLEKAGRTLTDKQRKQILDRFEPEGRPLYLKLAFEEARLWHSFDEPGRRDLAMGIPAIIRENLLARLSEAASHGPLLVSHALAYLAASRYGLSEDEVLDLLSADEEVKTDYKRRSPRSPDVNRLPVVVWSRLYFDLEPYLAEHAGEGTTLLAFYHRQLAEAAAGEYLGCEEGPMRHGALAAYFKGKADPAGDRSWSGGSVRGLGELPYHLVQAGDKDALYATMTDFRFLEHKAAEVAVAEHPGPDGTTTRTYAGAFRLQDDFELAIAKLGGGTHGDRRPLIVTGVAFGQGMVIRCPWCNRHVPFQEEWRGTENPCPSCQGPLLVNRFVVGERLLEREHPLTVRATPGTEADERQTTYEAFARALRREMHNLQHSPKLLWQQLYNRLQWEEGPLPQVLAPELAARSRLGSTLWFRTRTPFRESRALVGTLAGHTGSVGACAISADGRFIVSASCDKTLKLWDPGSRRQLLRLEGHNGWVWGCAFSPVGDFIVSASADRTLKLWDVASGAERATLRGHSDEVWGCAVSPDGSFIVSASADRTLKLWDVASGAEQATLRGHVDEVYACAVSPDGSLVVSASADRTLKLWDVASGKVRATLRGHSDEVWGCAVSPDGSFIVSASLDRTLRLWDVVGCHELCTLRGHGSGVVGCAVSPDGSFIVSAGSEEGMLMLWDPASGHAHGTLEGHGGAVFGCTVSPDASFVASVSNDQTVNLWDPKRATEPSTSTGHTDCVYGCAVSPDGSFVVSASNDRTLKLWDPAGGRELRTLLGHKDDVYSCAISPDSHLIVSASNDGTLKLWDVASGADQATMRGHGAGVLACAFSPDGSFVVSAGWDKTLKLWDPTSGRELRTLRGHKAEIRSCAVSPDAALVVSASCDNTLKVWDVPSGRELRTLRGHTDHVHACAFSADGKTIVSASQDQTLKLWDPEDGREMRTLRGHAAGVEACACSPDGSLVVSASWDRTLRLWDPTSGRELRSLPTLGSPLSVAVHPWLPRATCFDASGSAYFFDLLGFQYGPIIVTPVRQGDGLHLRCPVCREESLFEGGSSAETVDCPRLGCVGRMRPNSFATRL